MCGWFALLSGWLNAARALGRKRSLVSRLRSESTAEKRIIFNETCHSLALGPGFKLSSAVLSLSPTELTRAELTPTQRLSVESIQNTESELQCRSFSISAKCATISLSVAVRAIVYPADASGWRAQRGANENRSGRAWLAGLDSTV